MNKVLQTIEKKRSLKSDKAVEVLIVDEVEPQEKGDKKKSSFLDSLVNNIPAFAFKTNKVNNEAPQMKEEDEDSDIDYIEKNSEILHEFLMVENEPHLQDS